MPTGYTSDVANGKVTDLRAFALQCARGMGALIMMRDEPWGAPIPERFEPSTKYHDERIAEAKETLVEVAKLTAEECEKRAEGAHIEALQTYHRRLDEVAEERARYEAMIAKVEAWDCKPEGLKSFMLDQLRQSLQHDCSTKWITKPEPESGSDWRERVLKQAARDVGYHSEEREKEIARTESRNRWLAELMGCLPSEVAGEIGRGA